MSSTSEITERRIHPSLQFPESEALRRVFFGEQLSEAKLPDAWAIIWGSLSQLVIVSDRMGEGAKSGENILGGEGGIPELSPFPFSLSQSLFEPFTR